MTGFDWCGSRQPVGPLLLKMLLLGGRSVMPTAAVAGVCAAHPEPDGAAAPALSGSRHCIDLDKAGREKEGYRPAIPYAATNKLERDCEDEREGSNNMPHRRRDLEDLARLLPPKREGAAERSGGGGRAASSGGGKTGADTPDRGGSWTEGSSQKPPFCCMGGG